MTTVPADPVESPSAAESQRLAARRSKLLIEFAVPVSIIIILISVALAWFVTRAARKTLEGALRNRANSLAANLAYNSEPGILAGQDKVLQSLIAGVLQQEDVLYVEILGERGSLAAAERKGFPGVIEDAYLKIGEPRRRSGVRFFASPRYGIGLYEVAVPVVSATKNRDPEEMALMPSRPVTRGPVEPRLIRTIGSVRIGVSTARIAETVNAFARVVAGLTLASLGIVVAVVGLTIFRVVILPARDLADSMERIAGGELTTTVRVVRDNEIGRLARSFNTITTSLREARGNLEKKVEERTRDLELEVGEGRRAEVLLKLQTSELGRSNAELQQFAYVASHDLQEPLRMVASYVELLGQRYHGRLDADADEFIGYAVEGATRMSALLTDLLAYARTGLQLPPPGELLVDRFVADFEQVSDAKPPTDLQKIMADVLENLRLVIQESGAEITRGELPTLPADETQMLQLFQNLLSNAIKFRGPDPPQIDIRARMRGNEWLVSVHDNGIGLEMQFADRIFVIFQRLRPRTEFAGTGIGLAICKKIVEGHGGRIWVESRPGQGATFFFTLPA